MRKFDLVSEINSLMNNNIVNLISNIHEYKVKQNLYIEAKPDILSNLLSIAKIQSTSSSNRIEGIYTTDQRISEIVNNSLSSNAYSYTDLRNQIILELHPFISELTGRHPIILPVIMEVKQSK